MKHGSRSCRDIEDDMPEGAVFASDFLSNIGIFFLGVGVLWFVSVYKDNQQ